MPVAVGQGEGSSRERRSDVFEVWNRHFKNVFQLFGNTKELDNAFCLLAEMSIQSERFGGIHLGHFKIMFWPSFSTNSVTSEGFLTKDVDDTLVTRLEENE